ncbi:flagellin [Neobacillus sp. PS3-40]|uniref:flagellin n=1 Tax=Neobacillus sp. PS3-40 TaxID=3070679 RepID=UPI0027E05325|nr:flagellin [Neobacillus sp. PS3-40]WML46075.1 flagellin [Neobacillus sp. PS3-40]
MRLNSQFENKFFDNRRSKITGKLQKAIRNVSSGLKVLGAADNPAGLSISETTRSQIRGLAQAQRNIQDGMAFLKTTEDGLMKTNEDIQRLYEVSIMASNDTMDNSSRLEVQGEVDGLLTSIQQTAETVQFNTRNLLGPETRPDKQKDISIQSGPNSNGSMTLELMDITTGSLGLANASVETRENAVELMKTSKNAISNIAGYLSKIGSQYSSLENNLNNSLTLQNSLTTIEANIRDSDIGKEVMNLTINKLLLDGINTLHKYSDDQRQNFEKVLFE